MSILSALEDATGKQLVHVLESPALTAGEKAYLRFYFGKTGGFFSALFGAISTADEFNRARLALGFPDEVQGYLAWSRGDLHDRAREIAREVK